MRFEPRTPDEAINFEPGAHVKDFLRVLAGFVLGFVVLLVLLFALVDLCIRFLPAETEARWFSDRFDVGVPAADAGPRAVAAAGLLERLAVHWPRAPYAFRLRVEDTEAPNAFALPGGTLILTTGLLRVVTSENELAFVLGHELGHFRGRDHLQGFGRSLALGLVTLVLGGGSSGELASGLGSIALLDFGRDQERAADAFALQLLDEEYGHAAQATRFFERLAREKEADGTGAGLAWASTHPLTTERIEAIEALARRRGLSREGSVVPLPAVH